VQDPFVGEDAADGDAVTQLLRVHLVQGLSGLRNHDGDHRGRRQHD
jgi:hypothetical protein